MREPRRYTLRVSDRIPSPRQNATTKQVDGITESYGDLTLGVLQGAFRTGFVFLFFSVLLWVVVLIAVPVESRPDQIHVAIEATLFSLAFIGCYPLYRARWRLVVEPRVRALVEGNPVEGVIESIETTNERAGAELKLRINYLYNVNGREVRRTTIPFPPHLLRGREMSSPIRVYVSPGDPEHGEPDIFGIREG
jgi:hypothetical protein